MQQLWIANQTHMSSCQAADTNPACIQRISIYTLCIFYRYRFSSSLLVLRILLHPYSKSRKNFEIVDLHILKLQNIHCHLRAFMIQTISIHKHTLHTKYRASVQTYAEHSSMLFIDGYASVCSSCVLKKHLLDQIKSAEMVHLS